MCVGNRCCGKLRNHVFFVFSEITTRLGFSQEGECVWVYGEDPTTITTNLGVKTSACEQTERGAADLLSFVLVAIVLINL